VSTGGNTGRCIAACGFKSFVSDKENSTDRDYQGSEMKNVMNCSDRRD
jgi:hypothetical protein